jgi:hypothetical protein
MMHKMINLAIPYLPSFQAYFSHTLQLLLHEPVVTNISVPI